MSQIELVENKTGESVTEMLLKKMAEDTVHIEKPDLNFVESLIELVKYQILPDQRSTLCMIALKNGFTVQGISSTVSLSDFDEESGRIVAYKKAMDKVWDIAAFLCMEKAYQQRQAVAQKNKQLLSGAGLLFRHYSGALYRMLNSAVTEADQVESIVYQSVADGAVYIRPATEFYEKFTCIADINFKECKLMKIQAEYDESVRRYSAHEDLVSRGKPELMSDEEWGLIRSLFLPMRELHEIQYARLDLMRKEFEHV